MNDAIAGTAITLRDVIAFGLGSAATVFGTHYNAAVKRHEQRKRAARFLIRHFEDLREHLTSILAGMGDILVQRGANAFPPDVSSILSHRLSVLNQDAILDDLDDPKLRRSVEMALDHSFDKTVLFPREFNDEAQRTPPDLETVETFRDLAKPIETELIPHIDQIVLQLKERDVPFIWWMIRKVRQ